MIYKAIGKLVVKAVKFFLLFRYRRQLRIGAGALAVAIGVGAYLAARNVQEG